MPIRPSGDPKNGVLVIQYTTYLKNTWKHGGVLDCADFVTLLGETATGGLNRSTFPYGIPKIFLC